MTYYSESKARAKGYEAPITITTDEGQRVHGLVKANTDFDGMFPLWDCDEGDIIWVNGRLVVVSEGHD